MCSVSYLMVPFVTWRLYNTQTAKTVTIIAKDWVKTHGGPHKFKEPLGYYSLLRTSYQPQKMWPEIQWWARSNQQVYPSFDHVLCEDPWDGLGERGIPKGHNTTGKSEREFKSHIHLYDWLLLPTSIWRISQWYSRNWQRWQVVTGTSPRRWISPNFQHNRSVQASGPNKKRARGKA